MQRRGSGERQAGAAVEERRSPRSEATHVEANANNVTSAKEATVQLRAPWMPGQLGIIAPGPGPGQAPSHAAGHAPGHAQSLKGPVGAAVSQVARGIRLSSTLPPNCRKHRPCGRCRTPILILIVHGPELLGVIFECFVFFFSGS